MHKLDNVVCFRQHKEGATCMQQLFLADNKWCELCKLDFRNYVKDQSSIGIFRTDEDNEAIPF